MQLSGSSEQCRRAGEELRRAAVAVAEGAVVLTRLRSPDADWSGVAASCWSALAQQQAASGEELALRLATAGAALRQHAEGLDELQRRARALSAEAAAAGLHLTDDGQIAPVLLPDQPCATQDQDDLWQSLHRARLARDAMLDRVAGLRQHEAELHDRLLDSLRGLRAPWVLRAVREGQSLWAPTWWDAPSTAVAGAAGGAGVVAAGPVLAARSVPVLNVVGFGSGVYVDTEVNGMDRSEAVVKNGVLTGLGTGATVVVGGAAAAAGAPVWVTVGGGVVVGAGVSWVAGRVWDAIRRAAGVRVPGCPWAPGRQRPVPAPRPGEVGRVPSRTGPAVMPHPSPGARPQPPARPQTAVRPSR